MRCILNITSSTIAYYNAGLNTTYIGPIRWASMGQLSQFFMTTAGTEGRNRAVSEFIETRSRRSTVARKLQPF